MYTLALLSGPVDSTYHNKLSRLVSLYEGVGRSGDMGDIGALVRVKVLQSLAFFVQAIERLSLDTHGAFLSLERVVHLFYTVLDIHLPFTEGDQTSLCFQHTHRIVQLFSQFYSSKQELLNPWDLVLLLKLLYVVSEKDSLDFGGEKNSPDSPQPGLVVLSGFRFLVPLVSEESLLYPELAQEYFGLVASLVHSHCEKVRGGIYVGVGGCGLVLACSVIVHFSHLLNMIVASVFVVPVHK